MKEILTDTKESNFKEQNVHYMHNDEQGHALHNSNGNGIGDEEDEGDGDNSCMEEAYV